MSGRKFRRKVVAAEDDEGTDEPESLAVPPSSFKAKQARQQKERKEKKLAGKSLLSFGDDEEPHGPVLGKEKPKGKASGFRAAAAAAVLASSKPSAATQVSAPGESSMRVCSACLHEAFLATLMIPNTSLLQHCAGFRVLSLPHTNCVT